MNKYLAIVATSAFLAPVMSFAQATGQTNDANQLIRYIDGWLRAILPLLITLATVYFFWGLAKFVLNAGDESARTEAKGIMIWGVVAVFVMVTFFGLVGWLQRTLDIGTDVTTVAAPTMDGGTFTSPVPTLPGE